MPDIPIVVRYLGGDAVEAGMRSTLASATRLGAGVESAGTAGESGFQGLIERANEFAGRVEEAGAGTEKLTGLLGGVRNAGLGIGAAGVGGLLLANSLIESGNAAEAADSKMEAMLKKRGEGGRFQEMSDWAQQLAHDAALTDDDPIKDATAGLQGFGVTASQIKELMPGLIGQSRLYNQSMEQVAEAAGRAFGKGDVSGLTRIGITLTDEQLAKIEELKNSGASQAERQAALYALLKDSFKQYALSVTEGLGENEIAANRFLLQMDTMQDNIGKGASEAKTNVQGLLGDLLGVLNTSEDTQKAAGAWLYYGSTLTSVVGGVIAFGAQIGMAYIGFMAFIAARGVATTAAVAHTAATVTETAAITAQGAAASTTAGNMSLLARARALLGPGGASALGVLGGVAVGATVGALGLKEFVNKGINEPAEAFAEGEEGTQPGATQSADTVEGLLSQAEDLKKRREALLGKKEGGAPWWVHAGEVLSGGATSSITNRARSDAAQRNAGREREAASFKITEDALRARAARGETTGVAEEREAGGARGGLAAYIAPSIDAKASADALQGEIDAAQKQAEELSDRIDNENNERRKKALQDDLKHLQRHIKRLGEAKRSADKREAEAQKNKELRARIAEAQAQEGAALKTMEKESGGRIREAGDKAAMEAQIKDIEGQAAAGLIGKSEKEKRVEEIKAAYEGRDRALDAEDKAQLLRIKAQEIMATARIKASTQTEQEAKSTIAIAESQARILKREGEIGIREAAVINSTKANQPAELTTQQRILQYLGRTGSVNDLPRQGAGGAAGGGAAGGGQTVGQPTYSTAPDGSRLIQFPPLRVADPWAQAARAYGR